MITVVINEVLTVDFSSKVRAGRISEVTRSIFISVRVHIENLENVIFDVVVETGIIPDNCCLLISIEIVRLQSTEFIGYGTELDQI